MGLLKPNADFIIYNDYGTDSGLNRSRRWLGTIIRNVRWEETETANVVNLGTNNDSNVTVYTLNGVTDLSGYVDSVTWAGLPREQADNHWTINKGDRIIRLRENENPILVFDSAMDLDRHYDDQAMARYKRSITVVAFTPHKKVKDVIHHFQIVGRE